MSAPLEFDLDTEPEMVTLRGGVTVPVAAIELAIELESRGVTMRVEGDTLIVRPRSGLSEADVARVRAYRAELKRIAAYEAPTL